MLRPESKQLSFHTALYSKIPETHVLKQISKVVEFSFINELLAESYCKSFGRPAKEPELMCKLLFLQHLYNLSDERVREDASLNLAYMYFLGLNPEDSLPDKSLLSKFRCHRLDESTLDEIITEIVRQCVIKGIIKGTGISIDSTHIAANTIKKTPERLMKHLAKRIIKECQEDLQESNCTFLEVPNYKEIEDHSEAKAVMKDYLETVIETAIEGYQEEEKQVPEIVSRSQAILEDPTFILQKGIRSLIDPDARVGCKSKTESFFGYKTEFLMTTEERIITSVKTCNGAYVDGTQTKAMLDETISAGVEIEEFYGDKAYFRKPILSEIENLGATAYIPVSSVVYRIDETHYSYNKDSDEWFCSQGNRTVRSHRYKSKTKTGFREGYKYYFEEKQCRNCPIRQDCAGKQKRKILILGLDANEFYEISKWQKSDAFLEKYKKRAAHEGKNAELKRFHGLNRARGYGLKSVSKQSKLTAIAANIKRIAGILDAFFVRSHGCRTKISFWWLEELRLCTFSLVSNRPFRFLVYNWLAIPLLLYYPEGVMRRKITLTICMITLFGVLAFSHAAVKFSDVKINDWFSSSVIKLTDIGGIAGYPDGTFRPSGTITRAEFTSIVARSLGIKEKEISGDSWSAGIMAAAIDAGLVRSGEFPDVNTPVTRYEMARITVRALEYRKETLPSDYKDYSTLIKDLNKSEAFKDDIMKVVATGIIAGYPDKTFQGLKTLSRAEASIVVVKILDKSARNIPVKPSAVGQIALGETKPVTEIISNVSDLNKFNPNLKTVTLVTADSLGLSIEKTPGLETMQIKTPSRTGVVSVIKDGKTVVAFSGAYMPSLGSTLYDTTRFPVNYMTIDYFGFFLGRETTDMKLVENPWKE